MEQYDRDKQYQRHRAQLDQIRNKKLSSDDNRYNMLNNFKDHKVIARKFVQNQKDDSIQRNNELLLGRIVKIGTRDIVKKIVPVEREFKSQHSPRPSKKNYLRKLEERRIETDNLKIAKKLVELDANIPKEWENEMGSHQRVGKLFSKLHVNSHMNQNHNLSHDSKLSNRPDMHRRASSKIKLPRISKERSGNHSALNLSEIEDTEP